MSGGKTNATTAAATPSTSARTATTAAAATTPAVSAGKADSVTVPATAPRAPGAPAAAAARDPFAGDNVVVATRCRPFNARELALLENEKTKNPKIRVSDLWVVRFPAADSVVVRNPLTKQENQFTLNFCYDSGCEPGSPNYASQETVFRDLGVGLLKNSMQGYNATMFAYGQTGSGKTYTMMGNIAVPEQQGIIPRICKALFENIQERNRNPDPAALENWKVYVSFYEIYNEKIRDLFNVASDNYGLKVRAHPKLGAHITDLSRNAVVDAGKMLEYMDTGAKARASGSTKMNMSSSRSHAVFQINLVKTTHMPSTDTTAETSSQINLVDLAGSERQSKSEATGDRLKEACSINKSLAALGKVIHALVHGKFVHYRDSVLTWLLKESLGGNAKTVMITAISPSGDNFEETTNTLRYANDAKQIQNKAVINEDDNARMINELKAEVAAATAAQMAAIGDDRLRLQEQLELTKKLLEEKTMTWKQQLEETDRREAERKQAMMEQGISVSAFGVDKTTPYLVNLSDDMALAECLVYFIKSGVTRVGRADAQVKQDIVLGGFKINPQHAQFINNNKNKDVTLMPLDKSFVAVNGRVITAPTVVHQDDRIAFGQNLFFRFTNPNEPKGEGSSRKFDWTLAQKELSSAQQKWQTLLASVKDFNGTIEKTINDQIAEWQQRLDLANILCVRLHKALYFCWVEKFRHGSKLGEILEGSWRVHDLNTFQFQNLKKQELLELIAGLEHDNALYVVSNKLPQTELEKAREENARLQTALTQLKQTHERYVKDHTVPDVDHQKLHDRYNAVFCQKEVYKAKFCGLDDKYQATRLEFAKRLKEHETTLKSQKEEVSKKVRENDNLKSTVKSLVEGRQLQQDNANTKTYLSTIGGRGDYPYAPPKTWDGTIEQRIDTVLAKPRHPVAAPALRCSPVRPATAPYQTYSSCEATVDEHVVYDESPAPGTYRRDADHLATTSTTSVGLGGGGPFKRQLGEPVRQVKRSPAKRDSWISRSRQYA
eukprot:gnl/Spiro4/649_TR368_c0_g1_i1.p1 gnl/Spiro4/649_TR368_c0_g1~~gnl/Spiro4/649_TR368_c0_g1_i1.p1  ORF type:complete len:1006 (-),score=319.75 gnl/Spiro4/649_TR368_c0_g1_i1:111-3128(-)